MYRKEGGIFPRLLRYAPLTLSTLASLVPHELNAKITIHDEIAEKINYFDKPDLVAISAITGTANRAYAIADHYRRRGVTVVIGGVHASLIPQEAKKHADSIITGMAFESLMSRSRTKFGNTSRTLKFLFISSESSEILNFLCDGVPLNVILLDSSPSTE